MNKKILIIIGISILVVITGSLCFFQKNINSTIPMEVENYQKNKSNIVQQMENYEKDIINVLLNETEEIVRDVDTSQWNSFSDDVLGIQFKYPANVRVEYEDQVFAEEFSDVLEISTDGGAVDLFFYDEGGNRLGFIRALSIAPYTQLEDTVFEYIDYRTRKSSRKIDRKKKHESVGYMRVDNQIFPWTIVDTGHKDVFAMSDVIHYNIKTDNIKDIEIRFYGYSKKEQDFLYGILRTLKFN